MYLPPGKFSQPILGLGNIRGVSCTRLKNDENMKRWYGDVILILDGSKLSNKYKIVPTNDPYLKYGNSPDSTPEFYNSNIKRYKNQAEEFIIAPKGIKNLDKYLIGVVIPEEFYDMYTNPTRNSMYYVGDDLLNKINFIKDD